MKASELRIGNLIQNDTGNVFYVSNLSLDIDDEYNELIGATPIGATSGEVLKEVRERFWRPIILTEEWLVKFGFKCINEPNRHYAISDPNGYKDSHKISIFPTVNDQWQIAFSDDLSGYKDYIPTTKIKYVHQLQNLYFALTGE